MKNFYLPSPLEIKEACERIQATWSDKERKARSVCDHSRVKLRIIKESEIDYEEKELND